MKISIIVPVYNRPKELEELLESLHNQTNKSFEVIIVEDGSTLRSESVVEDFKDKLDIKYFSKENTGPGLSRNYGCEKASGDYCIFLDSDCVLPPDYFETVLGVLLNEDVDAFGGPDKAHKDFTKFQKAINYSMTSFLTTGGIRGGSEKLDKFHPRSFNMGILMEVFNATRGFSSMRFGEDIDMSIRILRQGFKTMEDLRAKHLLGDLKCKMAPVCTLVEMVRHARVRLEDDHQNELFQKLVVMAIDKVDYLHHYETRGIVDINSRNTNVINK